SCSPFSLCTSAVYCVTLSSRYHLASDIMSGIDAPLPALSYPQFSALTATCLPYTSSTSVGPGVNHPAGALTPLRDIPGPLPYVSAYHRATSSFSLKYSPPPSNCVP